MITARDTPSFTLNNPSLGDLKLATKQNSTQSISAVAKQFEGLFLNIMMRSMRSGGGTSAFDNDGTKLYTGLLDEQVSQKIANGRGMGLADALVKQMTRSHTPTIPSLNAPAIPLLLKKENTADPLTKGLPGAAATGLPLHRSEQPGALPLPGKTLGQRFEEKLSYTLQGSLLRAAV